MTRTRRLLLGLAVVAMPLSTLAAASPAAAGQIDLSRPQSTPNGSGTERMCVGVDDPNGQNTTWVCSPEAQWYGQVVAMVLSLKPV